MADQLGQCRDFAGLRFRLGFEKVRAFIDINVVKFVLKGIIVDWNVQREIWDRLFFKICALGRSF